MPNHLLVCTLLAVLALGAAAAPSAPVTLASWRRPAFLWNNTNQGVAWEAAGNYRYVVVAGVKADYEQTLFVSTPR